MTQLKKRAILSLLIWSIVMTALIVVFFSGGGPTTFLQGERKVTLSRVYVTVGFTAYFLMLFMTRIRRGSEKFSKDERDEQIARLAFMTGFTTIMAYVFLFCLFLYWFYSVYQNSNLMPVGWVWFLALSSVYVGYISHALATLVLDLRLSGHGKS